MADLAKDPQSLARSFLDLHDQASKLLGDRRLRGRPHINVPNTCTAYIVHLGLRNVFKEIVKEVEVSSGTA